VKNKEETTFAKKINQKAVKIVSWLAGSWWGVIFHTVWFAVWLIYHFDINILTLAVSLEAIFMGIFLLMASNEAEIARDKRAAAARRRSADIVDRLLDLETKIEKQQQQILKLLTEKNQEKSPL